LRFLAKDGNLLKFPGLLEIRSVSVFLSKIIGLVEPNDSGQRETIKKERKEALKGVLKKMTMSKDADENENCSLILCNVLQRENVANKNELLSLLFEPSEIRRLFDALGSKENHVFRSSINVILQMTSFLKEKKNEFQEEKTKMEISFLEILFEKFEKVLSELGHFGDPYTNSIGQEILRMGPRPPLTVQLFSSLLDLRNPQIFLHLQKHGVFFRVLKLFTETLWNNFFHSIAISFLEKCLETQECLQKDSKSLFKMVKILQKGATKNSTIIFNGKTFKRGNIGHIVLLSKKIESLAESKKEFQEILKSNSFFQ
jgi:hypothetical protein